MPGTVSVAAIGGPSVALVMAAAAIVGWVVQEPFLTSLVPGAPTWKVNAILAEVLLVLGLALGRRWTEGMPRHLASLLAGAAAVIGLLSIGEWLQLFDLPIEQLLFADPHNAAEPGLMAADSAIIVTALGFGILGRHMTRRTGWITVVAVSSLGLAWFNVLRVIYGSTVPTVFGTDTSMSLPGAIVLGLISIGLLGSLERGPVAVLLLGSSQATGLARRLVVAAFVVPPALGWLRLLGSETGLFDEAFGVALSMTTMGAVWAGLAWYTAVRVRASDLRRDALEAELSRSNRDLHDFAYAASHDLQEPLRKVQAFSAHLAVHLGNRLDDEGRDYLTRVQGSGQRMQQLVQDLLAYSRVQTRQQKPSLVLLDSLVHDALAECEQLIADAQAQINVAELPALRVDPPLMRQLFVNLIANAIKFRKDGVRPEISISAAPITRDQGRDRRWRIEVTDNGIGFENTYAERIFAPFERLHSRATYTGTGLGLAICRRVAERHGGTLTAAGVPGAGATFTLDLPATTPLEEPS